MQLLVCIEMDLSKPVQSVGERTKLRRQSFDKTVEKERE